MGYIEGVHKKNFKRIKEHNIQLGQNWRHKGSGRECKITHIHSMYGWVVTEPYGFHGGMDNINEWERV